MVYKGYSNEKEEEPGYGKKKKQYKSSTEEYQIGTEESRMTLPRERDDLYELERLRKEVQTVKQGMPRMEELKIQSLNRKPVEVIGTLFDRVKFLKERIDDIRGNIETRKKLHNEIDAEIEKDIREKEDIAAVVSDINERRNFKLDISILRRERRNEAVQFWKDMLELETELQEIMEQYETESRISSLFGKDIISNEEPEEENKGNKISVNSKNKNDLGE